MCLLFYSHLSFFVIGMVPVVHGASFQDQVTAIPHPVSTDQLKHRLGKIQQFKTVVLICFFSLI